MTNSQRGDSIRTDNTDITDATTQTTTAVNTNTTATGGSTPSINIFRETPLRYLGYANEIGESFRYQYPKHVMPSYVLAFGYCIADAINTGYKSYYTTVTDTIISNSSNNKNSSHANNHLSKSNSTVSADNIIHQQEQQRIRRAMVGTMDTLLWQSLASVMIPGYVIHTIVKATKYGILPYAVPKQIKVPLFIATWLPTMLGLGAIPFIVHPIDHSVDYMLDNTVRRFYHHYL